MTNTRSVIPALVTSAVFVIASSPTASAGPTGVKWTATVNASASGSTLNKTSGAAVENVVAARASTAGDDGTTLRVLQWNVDHGGLGEDGVLDPNRIANWAASFNPDIISFNEIEKNDSWGDVDQPALFASLMEQLTGKTWYYVFAQEWGQWDADGKGNLILSTYPIDSSDLYELVNNYDRSIAAVQITVNNVPITFMSTHLEPYDPTLRLTQALEAVPWTMAEPENRILAGDMNAWPNEACIGVLEGAYLDSWTVAVEAGTAIAFPGNNGETKNGRIDYIYYSPNAPNLTLLSSQVFDVRDDNGLMPSDHRPVLTTFIVQ